MEIIAVLLLVLALLIAGLLWLGISLVQFAVAGIEFLVLALTQGSAIAKRQFQLRWVEWVQSLKASRGKAEETADPSGRRSAIRFLSLRAIFLVAVLCGGTGLWWSMERVEKRRIAETHDQAKALAERYAKQLQDDRLAGPQSGWLHERDAWQRQLELQVEKRLLDSMVVVRSTGPDGVLGSSDDIRGVQRVNASVSELGGEIANQSFQVLRKGAAALLPRNQSPADERPSEVQE